MSSAADYSRVDGCLPFMSRADLIDAQLTESAAVARSHRSAADRYAGSIWDARDDEREARADVDRGISFPTAVALVAAADLLAAAEENYRAAVNAYRAAYDETMAERGR